MLLARAVSSVIVCSVRLTRSTLVAASFGIRSSCSGLDEPAFYNNGLFPVGSNLPRWAHLDGHLRTNQVVGPVSCADLDAGRSRAVDAASKGPADRSAKAPALFEQLKPRLTRRRTLKWCVVGHLSVLRADSRSPNRPFAGELAE